MADTPQTEMEEDFPEDPRLATMRRLVTGMLWAMIIGITTITLTLVWKIKQTPVQAVTGLQPGERLVSAEATAERVSLTIQGADGSSRVVVLDGKTFLPLAQIEGAAPK
ncbi:MAG: DUF6476 family protein [Neomegalonema sp.]|nr:DUF6476 family protein [Neomegalonema sp.]